jgi:hypothetical protein
MCVTFIIRYCEVRITNKLNLTRFLKRFYRQYNSEIKRHFIVNNLVTDTHSLLFGDYRTL